jgi:hypothetical protein
MAADFHLTPTTGLVGGMTVQFAEGAWPGEIGSGVAMTDEAFNIIEPLLRAAAPGWTSMHRYGVFELTPSVRADLTKTFKSKVAEYLQKEPEAQPKIQMLEELSAWLEARADRIGSVSVLGY